MARKKRVWSRAVMRAQPQQLGGASEKRVIPARRASRFRAPKPSSALIAEASLLEDQRIIGVSRSRSRGRRGRARTDGRRR
jgi:hypothetical protein